MKIARFTVEALSRLLVWLAGAAQGVEGVNLMLRFMPARLAAPTLRRWGARIGRNVELHTPIVFHNVRGPAGRPYARLHIGDNCYLGREVFIDLADDVVIEDNVTISMRATLLTHTHAGRSPLTETKLPPRYAGIRLRSGCYIGACATLLPGVSVGEEAIVGAGAVVTRPVAPGATVGGVPARPIGAGVPGGTY